MTQQALIDRLRKVEEALEDGCCAIERVVARFHDEVKGYCSAEHASLDSDAVKARTALSDLRELIKEAEGQKAVARTIAKVTNTGYAYIKAIDRTIQVKTLPYTALGEKL